MKMVTKVLGSKAAVYQKPVSGDPLAPFHDPGDHLDKVLFHSDLDFYRRHMGPTEVTVSLPAVAGSTRQFTASPRLNILGQVSISDISVLTHSLGYVPNYDIIWNGGSLIDGDLVQEIADAGGSRGRYLSHWADETDIYISSRGISSDSSLPSMSFTCTVVVYKLGQAAGNVVFDFSTATGRLTLGKGMFDSDEVLLRAQGQAGDSPYDIALGQSIDIRNGRSRVARPNGTVSDESGYNGSFIAPASFQGVIS